MTSAMARPQAGASVRLLCLAAFLPGAAAQLSNARGAHKHKHCNFTNTPVTPFFWDATCAHGLVGCFADGQNVECRFCGADGYGNIPCPKPAMACDFTSFATPPTTPYFWDPSCLKDPSGLGCNADGANVQCRFCGGGAYAAIPCQCAFDNPPRHQPYYWEAQCPAVGGGVGCNADGRNSPCRFCGGSGSYRDIPCRCSFVNEPADVGYYWEPSCAMGVLGCLADGDNVQCRFCGSGDYSSIPCPSTATTTMSALV